MAPPRLMTPGTAFSGYVIEDVLGRSESSVVYAARQPALDRAVALKVMERQVTGDLRMLQVLDHPNIVPIYDTGEVDDRSFVAMRLIRGASLKEMIVAGELDSERTLRILEQVAGALDSAHRAGLVHRDVKPQNVLVEGDDHAYLADFLGSRGGEGQFIGTLDYMPPEIVLGHGPRPASDIYALTCVLYECLTGSVAYPRPTSVAVLFAHAHEAPPAPTELRPDLPAELDAVIARGMAKDPGERPATATDLMRDAARAFERAVTPRTHTLLEERLAAAARVGVVPADARLSRAKPRYPIPPARSAPPPPEPPEAFEGEPPAMYHRRSSWLRAGRGLVFAALAGGAAYLIIDRLLGSTVSPPIDLDERDEVACTAFAPPTARPGDHILVQVFAHRPEDADHARDIAQEMDLDAVLRAFRSLKAPVRRGSRLDFELHMPGLVVDDPVTSLIWRGRTESVQFGVEVPRDARGSVLATLGISQDGLPLGHVKFKLQIGGASRPEPCGDQARRYRAAFISYASKDRDEVLSRVQMLPLVGVDYLIDVLNLEPGSRWAEELEAAIGRCDLFLLFWSSEAKRSEHVRREVQFALRRRGDDDLAPPEIKPVILEGPPIVPPWDELAHIHFNDRLLYFMRPD